MKNYNENSISVWRLPAECAPTVMGAIKFELLTAIDGNDFDKAERLLDILRDMESSLKQCQTAEEVDN